MSESTSLLPLRGRRVVELAAIGPVPHAALLLAQLGAAVIRVSAPGGRDLGIAIDADALLAQRTSVTLDLKTEAGRQALWALLERADILLEGLRPGTLERLGLAPADLHARFPRLVIGRCSGWGDVGERAATASHDINALALSGVLGAVGPSQRPVPPLNLVADFGGAALHLATGVLAATCAVAAGGKGAVVKTSLLQAATALTTHLHGLRRAHRWVDARESNLLDGGAPFYRCYRTADDRWMAIGAIESRFFAAAVDGLQARLDVTRQYDESYWPVIEGELARCFALRTRDAWDAVFRLTDACVTPVLDWPEVAPHTAPAVTWHDGVPGCGVTMLPCDNTEAAGN
jgi:alpha-methylacyl-CoA racemase